MARMTGSTSAVELHPSRALLGLLTGIGTLEFAAGIAMVTGFIEAGEPGAQDALTIAGSMLIVTGVVFAILFLTPLLWPAPSVVADRDGLHRRSRFSGALSFAWSDVAALGYWRRGKKSGLGIWLREPERWLEKRPAFLQPLLRLQQARGGPTLRLSVMATTRAIREFASAAGAAFGVEVRT